jgi:site-specific recombinase XerD
MTFEAEYRSSLHQWHVAAYKEKKFKEKPVQLIRHWQVPNKFPKIALSFARRIP